MTEEKETLFESLITQIQDMKPSWERTGQIEYLIHTLDTKPGLLKRMLKRWPFLVYNGTAETDDKYLSFNYWTAWNRHGWEFIWKRFIIEVGLHYDRLSVKTKEHFSMFDTKEKFGTLRVSLSGYDDKFFELESVLDQLSSITCANCGKQPHDSKGRNLIWITSGYIMPYCKECFRKYYFKHSRKDVSKSQYRERKQKFSRYAKKCRTVVPYFISKSVHNNCKTYIFRQPAYNWLETYKKEKEWSDGRIVKANV